MKSRWIAPLVIAAMWAFALWAYPQLPEQVPTHWNLRGEVDGWSGRAFGAFLMPAVATLMIPLLLYVLPAIGPRRENLARFRPELRLIASVIALFLLLMQVLTLGVAMGWPVDVTRAMLAGVGLLFAVIGNYLPRIRSNWWMGIRTPWTLDSDRVWRETHRLGGRTFVAGGLLAALAALLPDPARAWVAVAALGAAALIPAVYSYFAWRRDAGRAA